MSVPMSQYEALLEEVRCLRRKAQHVQQLAAPLISSSSSSQSNISNVAAPINQQIRLNSTTNQDVNQVPSHPCDFDMESLGLNLNHQSTQPPSNNDYEHCLGVHNPNQGAETLDNNCSEDEYGRISAGSTHMSVSSEPISQKNRGMANLYHGTWPVERTMWNSEPTNLGPVTSGLNNRIDHTSVMSFASSSGGAPLDRVLSSPDHSRRSSQQLEAKMDMVYSLLAMLGGQEHADMGETLLALSTSPESCLAMRQSGCIPLLVQLVQSDKDGDTRKKASQALHNLVYAQPDEKLKKRETRVLKLLEQARLYTEALRNNTEYVPDAGTTSEEGDLHPTLTVAHVMKLSFDEGHRQAICQLGGIHVIANLVETEHSIHGSTTEDTQCILMRRYACMALTNLTFGDSGNKALLCSFKDFMRSLVVHLQSPSDELRQVTASVLRNLSWRADPVSKEILREVGTVTGLMKAAMMDSKENTLKSILSALWNLSAHCTENKAEICAIEGALGFLVDMLSYKTPSKSLAVIENSGGILRNISSQIAVREDYRQVLRLHNCLQVLLEQLKSPSLTIVSNACGTLWNLSAKNAQDQETLWQMGAPSMLRSLNHSKHKMIAMGSSAALKNLLSSRPSHSLLPQMDATAKAMDLPILPTLGARKQKALLQDLDQNLHETFDNIDSPTKTVGEEKFDKYIPTQEFIQRSRKKHILQSSEMQECIVSHTELVYESKTSRSDNSLRSELVRSEERLSRREEHQSRKESWKDELKIDITKTRLPTSRRDDYHLDLRETDPAHQLCQPFASLNISEPSTSSIPPYQKEYHHKKVPQSQPTRLTQTGYGSSSLPYAKRPGAYIPVRNNYSDCAFEDEIDSGDQPIDFSRKYDEMKSSNHKELNKTEEKVYQTSATIQTCNDRSDAYGIYAETDLDQPTDYSLRYAEDDSDSDLCDKKNEFIQDTVKTYYTEGTPYETPFNFSTATSMSDLRIETNDKVIDNDNSKKSIEKTKVEDKNPPSDLDEKDHCSVEDISENESRQKSNDKVLKSQFSSGLMSPEKPIHYCEEGTPGYFSRVSSFGSLNSIPANENLKLTKDDDLPKENETIQSEQEIEHHKTETSPHEGTKAVKFEQTVNYAEETPLMFSRSSSLASLDSVEQHSIHDDRSSVVSDFSRLTSGLVSPSELPDSPSQTVPPSPKPRKGPLEYPTTSRIGGGVVVGGSPLFQRTAADGRPQPAPRSIQKPSVFEDNVTKFKEESTPVQFSSATSLSSLTIDDHDEAPPSNRQVKASPAISQISGSTVSQTAIVPTPETNEKQEEATEKTDDEREKEASNNVSSEPNDDFVHISDDEADDDILADCINIGMQNNRHRQSKENVNTTTKLPTPSFKYSPKLRPQSSGIPLSRTSIPMRSSPSKVPETTNRLTKPEMLNTSDTIRTYCTEDTPAILSHAGSNSDLSTISIPNEVAVKKEYLSDDSSNLSGDNGDNILAECIQSAMPKPKKPAQKPLGLRQIPTLTNRNIVTTSTPIKPFNRDPSKNESKLKMPKEDALKKSKMPVYMAPRDETKRFAIENSPCQFSLRSSLSDLTVDSSSIADLKRLNSNQNEASGSSYNKQIPSESRPSLPETNDQQISNLSRQGSLSSLSVESVGSLEAEQALLEQCISSGMPKSKVENNAAEKPIGVATKQYNVNTKLKYDNGVVKQRFVGTTTNITTTTTTNENKPKLDDKKKYTSSESKNVFVTSVVENTIPYPAVQHPEDILPVKRPTVVTATTADVREINDDFVKDQSCRNSTSSIKIPMEVIRGTSKLPEVTAETGTLPGRYSPINEISSIDRRNSGFDNDRNIKTEESYNIDDTMPCIVDSPILDRYSTSDYEFNTTHYNTTPCSSDNTQENNVDCPNSINLNGMHLKHEKNDAKELFNKTSIDDYKNNILLLDDLSPQLADNQIISSSDSTENLGQLINNRMLDPDAMIESLDRFTAELVSQAASHMQQQKEESKFQASIIDGDTWNDDISPNDVTFPSISGSTPNVITFSDEINQENVKNDDALDLVDGIVENEQKSNDFSSLNTSTLTESTLIAMEATKMATTFRNEADMSISGASIELDSILPPSQLNSLTNSTNELESKAKKSPKMIIRKKSLPQGLMVRRALSNSLNQASSIESLENHSLSNLDNINAPSMLGDIDFLDLESSMTSVASLQSEIADAKTDFLVNGVVNNNKEHVHPIFEVKQPVNMLHLVANNSHYSELENINPPSVFNEITDLCNSLADIPTDGVTSELDVFEDCYSATNIEATLMQQTENDITTAQFSDANSITPIQTDVSSSNESTPRKTRRLLTAKQKRNLSKDRYRTYTINADVVMRSNSDDSSNLDDYKTIASESCDASVPKDGLQNRITPKERRQMDRSRFETQILDQSTTKLLKNLESATNNSTPLSDNSHTPSPSNSPTHNPSKTKLSIRRNFLQKRLENKDRFKTKTISESSLSPEVILSASPTTDLHLLLQKEADVILKTLSETKARTHDELLDCETLSLVSNEDDSEYNSGCSIQYRTYHKSWGITEGSGANLPIIETSTAINVTVGREDYEECNLNVDQRQELEGYTELNGENSEQSDLYFPEQNGENSEDISLEQNFSDQSSEHENEPRIVKPKIVKPEERVVENDVNQIEEQGKGIRGRRKALYSKTNISKTIKPPSTTSANKTSISKIVAPFTNKNITTNKPPLPKTTRSSPNNVKIIPKTSPKQTSPAKNQIKPPNIAVKTEKQKNDTLKSTKPTLERQGTFTKEDGQSLSPKNKPTTPPASSSIPKPTRIARAVAQPPLPTKIKNTPNSRAATGRSGLVKSASTDRTNRIPSSSKIINRSPSADARDVTKRSSLQYSSSNSNLKSSGTVKRASVPETSTQRSSSNSSLTSNSSAKQISSKIAGLWKKSQAKTDKKNSNHVLNGDENSSQTASRLIRCNSFEKNAETNSKHISRLGSFVIMDESETRIEYERRNIINKPPEIIY